MTTRYLSSLIPSLISNLIRVLVLCLLPLLASAQYEGMTPTRLLQELETSINGARQLEPVINANIARIAQFRQEAETINRESTRYQQEKSGYDSDLAKHNADVASYNKACGSGNYTDAELKRCEALQKNVERAQAALNNRRAALEKTRSALKQRQDDYNRRENERAVAAEKSLSQYETYNRNVEVIIARLQAEAIFSANQNCFSRPSPEASLQCLRAALANR